MVGVGHRAGGLRGSVAMEHIAHEGGDRPGGGVEAVGAALARCAGKAQKLVFELRVGADVGDATLLVEGRDRRGRG